MNVLIIGSGGREHALAFKIAQSPSVAKLYIAPGNPGTEKLGVNVSIKINDHAEVIEFCRNNDIELVVIGPEIPLVAGLSNDLRKEGVKVFGPSSEAAAIEGDKAFAKELMKAYNIPTASFKVFSAEHEAETVNYLKSAAYPLVVKASGLAAGKGVLICSNFAEAETALRECFSDKVFGQAGNIIVIEEFMYGQEASVFAITDGQDFVCLPAAQDHKRIGDGDTGKNTGGMGAYAPAPIITKEILKLVEESIISPTLNAMKLENRAFMGCLYCGLMLTEQGPKVVEFNCRFGDPETQAVLPLLEGDFAALLYSSAAGKLDKDTIKYNGGSAVCVVLASQGYPENYDKGFEIDGLDEINEVDALVFHAGTKRKGDKVITDGGRVLGVTAVIKQNDLRFCKQKAYAAVDKISFDGKYFRKDIADKAFSLEAS